MLPSSMNLTSCAVPIMVWLVGAGWGGPLVAATPEAVPLAVYPKGPATTLFETVPSPVSGLQFRNPIDAGHDLKFLYASSMSTGGVAVGDVDGNGLPDVFLAGGPVSNKLFLQRTPWKFEDATTAAGGVDGGSAWAVGCALVDVEGDGDLDLYVCNYLSPNQLYLNQGAGVFVEGASRAGVDFSDASHTPSFCDYDGDGDLDLYVLTNRWYRPEGFPEEQTIEVVDGKPRIMAKWEKHYDAVQVSDNNFETHVVGRPDRLFRNNGNGTFTDVTLQAGIRHRGHGLSATWFDWTGDHKPDLWVGNDFNDADALYRNNGDGTFTDVTRATVPYTTWFSMGADFGDLDGDGWMDFYIADMAGSTHFKQKTAMGNMGGSDLWFMQNERPPQLMRNGLFINARNGRFVEGAWLAGLAKTNWTWAVRLADFDNDGINDVYVQAGMSRNFNEKDDPRVGENKDTRTQWDRYQHLPPMKEPCLAYQGQGGMEFKDVSAAWGLDHLGMSYGCALSDLDRDGDLDLISVRLDEEVALLRNNSQEGKRVLLSFSAAGANPRGVGTWLQATVGGKVLVREVTLTRGYLGQDEAVAALGLGTAARIDRLEVVWPDGKSQEFKDLAAGHHYTLKQEKHALAAVPPVGAAPLFARHDLLKDAYHKEQKFDDFAREPLLPNSLAYQGPSQAWGDVDGDGDSDYYQGQGKGASRFLWINDAGNFRSVPSAAVAADAGCEDMGCVFFDADGDRDLDLYVVSGGVECSPDDVSLQDRLYLNDGKGGFAASAPDALPLERDSGGPVAAADFDNDGDLDLFVGGRSVPGAWPTAAVSRLLQNNGGKFTDVTVRVAPALVRPGMITGARWADLNGDRAPDLVTVGEWMAPRVFLNQKGQLVEKADPALSILTGWWNDLRCGDLDGDGDLDFVATNFGLNSKYHASADKPAMVYYGDLDGTGSRHIVEAEWEGATVFPVRGKSCSSLAMPFIKKKFSTFRDFALASLPQIYEPERLKAAQRFAATELRSGVFLNDGGGSFAFRALPWEVQTAPAFGVVISDINGDGRADLIIAQNFSHAQVETQSLAGGLSLLLLGRGDHQWQALRPPESGISIPADARSVEYVTLNHGQPPMLVFGRNQGSPAVYRPVSRLKP